MKLGARWAVAVLIVCAGAAPSLGAEDLGDAVTVNAIDARVLETGLPWAPWSGGACSVSLQVSANKSGARVLAARLSRVARMADDTGRDLWPVPGLMSLADAPPVSVGQGAVGLTGMHASGEQVWGLRAPAEGARTVRAVGTVTVLLGIGTEQTRVAGVRLERGQRITAGDVSLEIAAPRDGGSAQAVAKGDLEDLPDNVDWVLGLDEPSVLYEDTFPPGEAESGSDKPEGGSLTIGSLSASSFIAAPSPPGAGHAVRGGVNLRLRAHREMPDLAGLDFYDAKGKKVEAQLTNQQSMWTGRDDEPMQKLVIIDMHLSREIDVADVVVRRWRRVEVVEVPFTVDVPLDQGVAGAEHWTPHEPHTVAELLPPKKEQDAPSSAPPFQSATLRMPYAYVLDAVGTLHVYRLPERGWATGLRPVFTVPNAGDGIDLEAVGDALLCSRAGALEVYTLEDPARPAHVGRVGPQEAQQSADIATDGQRFYLVCRHAIVAYDVSTPTPSQAVGCKQDIAYWLRRSGVRRLPLRRDGLGRDGQPAGRGGL